MNFSSLLPNKIFSYQLYIFQLEEYDTKRFVSSLLKKGLFPPKSLRKKVVWTTKAKLLSSLSLIIQLGFATAIAYLINAYTLNQLALFVILFLLIVYVLIILSFAFLVQAQDILKPLEDYQKSKVIKLAKEKLSNLKGQSSNLKVIGVTGSYGKTTMKEVLKTVLGSKFVVVSTPENLNTPIGISRTILKNLDERTEIFVVEMGEYVKGDVDAICKLTPPDISIITGINEAHLERYGTMQNAIDTKFEIVENTPNGGLILLNADDELTVQNYSRFAQNKNIQWYSAKNSELSKFVVDNVHMDVQNLTLNFDLSLDNKEKIEFNSKVLADYIIGYIQATIIIGKELGMSNTELRIGVSKIKPVEHRLEAKRVDGDVIIIDDTYNGNSDGIKKGIELLSKFDDRRKVYITPGLVETGSLTESIHIEIGKRLSQVADLVVLTKNSATPFIEKGLLDSGFNKENIIWFETSKETYSSLNKFVKSGDVVMMQNDWSDNYS